MTRYKVTLEFEMNEVIIHAKSEAEARKLAIERFKKGTIKAKLLPGRFSSRGSNPCAESWD